MIKKIFPSLKYISYLLWVPLILTISFEIITFSDWIYEFNWGRNNISYKSNLTNNELDQVSNQIKDYFKNDDEKISINIERDKSVNLFNQREIDHMVDVKNLIKFTLLFERISLVIIFFTLIISSYINGLKEIQRILIKIIYKSFIIWSGIILLIILGMVVNFNYTFTLFHKIFFRNDLWILDPRSDYLLIMFPERFFLEICIIILLLFTFINLFLISITWLLRKRLNPI
ncbi:MAG: TIGR01906 family membrane protein [Chloroflexi bacterium]|nr:TIGR01906 family membrane protein [Chloroflexota bacterium]